MDRFTPAALLPPRPLGWCLLALLLYTLLGFFGVPWFAERTATQLLDERLDLELRVERLAFNPFTFMVEVDDLAVRRPEIDEQLIGLGRARINFEPTGVFQWAYAFDELHLDGLRVRAHRFADGSTNLDVLAERWAATAPEETAEPEPEPEETSGAPLRLVIDDLQLNDGSVDVLDDVPEVDFRTRLGPLNLNVGYLSTLPESKGDQRVAVTLDDDIRVEWQGDIGLFPLESVGRLTIEGPLWGIVDRYLSQASPVRLLGGDASIGFDYAVNEADGGVTVALSELAVTIADTRITEAETDEEVLALASVSLEGGSVRWPQAEVSAQRFEVAGLAAHMVRRADESLWPMTLIPATEPELEAADEAPVQADRETESEPQAEAGAETSGEPWRVELAEIGLVSSRLEVRDEVVDTGFDVQDIALGLRTFSLEEGRAMPLEASFRTAKGASFQLGGDLTLFPELQFSGDYQLQELPVGYANPYLAEFAELVIEEGRLALAGKVSVSPVETLALSSALELSDLRVVDGVQQEDLLSIATLGIDDLRFELDAGSLSTSTILLDALFARFEIDSDGTTNVGRTLRETDDDGSAGSVDSDDGPGMSVLLGGVQVDSGSMHFSDQNLPLPFSADIKALNGRISALGTQSDAATTIDLEGQVDEYGLVRIDGRLFPQAMERDTELSLNFENLDVPRYTPYSVEFAGRRIDSGRLDLDLGYRVENGALQGANDIVLRDFTLGEKVPSPDAVSLPLDLAIGLLKDANGVIDIDLPVAGQLDDPEFSYGSVIGRALVNLLTGIVTAPFRMLGNLVGADEDFGDIRFERGRDDLSPPEREKLSKLSEALALRPNLSVAIPAVVWVEEDSAVLRSQAVLAALSERLGADATTVDSEVLLVALEELFEERNSAEALEAVRLANSTPDADEVMQLDRVSFGRELADTLEAAVQLPPSALTSLGDARAGVIFDYLMANGLGEAQVSRGAFREDEPQPDRQRVALPLEVQVGAD